MSYIVHRSELAIPNIRVKRPHTKSRLGCRTCKRRRVRCDQAKPQCQSCLIRGLECSYAADERPKFLQFTPVPDSRTESESSSTASASPNYELSVTSAPTPFLEISDAGLAQHFLSHTVPALTVTSMQPEQSSYWGSLVPGLAYSSTLVRHGMLTLASLCLFFDNEPSSSYTEALYRRAELHGVSLIEQCRRQLQKSDKSDLNAVLAGSRMIAILGLAYYRRYRQDGIPMSDPRSWNWVRMLRGTFAVQETVMQTDCLSQCLTSNELQPPVEPNFDISDTGDDVTRHPGVDERLLRIISETSQVRFEAIRRTLACQQSRSNAAGFTELRSAIGILENATGHICSRRVPSVFRIICTWPCNVSEAFINMLVDGNDFALVIYSHWLMLMVLMEDSWWIHDMGRAGIAEIWSKCCSNETWKELLEWPMQMCLERERFTVFEETRH